MAVDGQAVRDCRGPAPAARLLRADADVGFEVVTGTSRAAGVVLRVKPRPGVPEKATGVVASAAAPRAPDAPGQPSGEAPARRPSRHVGARSRRLVRQVKLGARGKENR